MELGIGLVSWLDLEQPSAYYLVLGNLSTCICLGTCVVYKPSPSSCIHTSCSLMILEWAGYRTLGWAVGFGRRPWREQLGAGQDRAAIPRTGSQDPLEPDFGYLQSARTSLIPREMALDILGVSSCLHCISWMVILVILLGLILLLDSRIIHAYCLACTLLSYDHVFVFTLL